MADTGALKRALQVAIEPDIFDFWAGHFSRLLSWQRPLARIVAREPSARDAVTLTLQPNRHLGPVRPGQHLPVTVSVDGVLLTRQYSPVLTGKRLAITVKRVPGGSVSTHLTRRAKIGDLVALGQPFGALADDPAVPKWLFAAAGSGITPLMSLLRAQAGRGGADTVLLYWARTRGDLCFLAELRGMAHARASFRFIPVLTREAKRLPGEGAERPNAEDLSRWVPDLAARKVFACGPAGFVRSFEALTRVQASSFTGEAFTVPESSTQVGAPVRVTLARSGRVVEIPSGKPLLVALEELGEQPPFGCRMGVCHTCVSRRLEGTSEDLLTGIVQQEPGMLRLCVCAARSNLILDL